MPKHLVFNFGVPTGGVIAVCHCATKRTALAQIIILRKLFFSYIALWDQISVAISVKQKSPSLYQPSLVIIAKEVRRDRKSQMITS